ncbi:hypothetical protein [Streptomyces flavofungini]|uniref:hypothetical protein n=1 Tax=Streptomyces flavofungini TaxID=68200 RepID=UPI003F54084A
MEQRGQLLLVCPHPRTLALLRIVRLCGVFRPYPTLGAALAEAAPAKRRSWWTEGRLSCRRNRSRARAPS